MRRIVIMVAAVSLTAAGLTLPSHAATPQVLRVGTWHGIAGQYTSIQSAVDAAKTGDWILVGPGDYKEHDYTEGNADEPAGVLIETAWIHLRGMDRNSVVVDGTKAGAPTCSGAKNDQVVTKDGLNGVEAFKVDGVYIDNLTVCNYLTGTNGGEGNEIWWNGGDGTGKIGMGPWWGNYITATSTYSNGVNNPRGEYGIFVSNAKGPGSVIHSYASNMGDAAYYIGACPDCNALIDDAHGEYSALAYSGTNSGGHLVIQTSEWDNNKAGPTSNSQNNDDAPSPESGACPGGASGPLGLGICTIWENNYSHDNNNPNVPGAGAGSLAGAGVIGSGFTLAGTRNIALYHNRIEHNGGWGVVVADLPDQEQPPTDIGQNCQGGQYAPGLEPGNPLGQDPLCWYDVIGNAVIGNTFKDNGFFGNATNGDLAYASAGLGNTPPINDPGNCFKDNTDPAGVTEEPPGLQENPITGTCPAPPNTSPDAVLTAQLACATQIFASVATCPSTPATNYPQTTNVVLHMPPAQPTMPNPCAGVPANPWCPAAVAATQAAPKSALPRTGTTALVGVAALLLVSTAMAMRRRWMPRRRDG